MSNIIKSLTFLFCIGLVLIPLNIIFHKSHNSTTLKAYNESNIRKLCPEGNQFAFYQECFRKDLAKTLSKFSPMDVFYILNSIDNVYELEKKQNLSDDQKILREIIKYENYILFLQNQNNLVIHRDKLDFYSIPIIPFAKLFAEYKIYKIKKDLLNNLTIENQTQDLRIQTRKNRIKNFLMK